MLKFPALDQTRRRGAALPRWGLAAVALTVVAGCAEKSQPAPSDQADKGNRVMHTAGMKEHHRARPNPTTVFTRYREAFAKCTRMQAKAQRLQEQARADGASAPGMSAMATATKARGLMVRAKACRRAWRATVRSKQIEAGLDPARVPALIERWVARQLMRANARLRKRYGPPPKRTIE